MLDHGEGRPSFNEMRSRLICPEAIKLNNNSLGFYSLTNSNHELDELCKSLSFIKVPSINLRFYVM